MSNRFMISVAAAALMAATGFANAQGMGGGREGGAGGAGAQQSAPASPSGGAAGTSSPSAGAPGAASREGSPGGMKSSQSEEKGRPANRNAQQDMKSGGEKGAMGEKSTGEKSAQDRQDGRDKSKSTQNEKGAAGKDMKAEDRNRAEGKGEDRNRAEGKGDDRNRAEGRDNAGARDENRSTVGQAGSGAKLNTEQRTKITTVIRNQHVAPVTNVNFAVSIGTRVPREVGFHPLPTEIVTIYPEWRGYEFFLVREQIVVVDPRTLEIVAVLDA
jgi:uncharacterized protein DUF1236